MESVRELSFEEEATLYEKEARAEFDKELPDCDGPEVNGILRRGMRIIQKARELINTNNRIIMPCKLHEPIYYMEDGEVYEDTPFEATYGLRQGERTDTLSFCCEDGFYFDEDDIGVKVFLTEEAAVAALRERSKP